MGAVYKQEAEALRADRRGIIHAVSDIKDTL